MFELLASDVADIIGKNLFWVVVGVVATCGIIGGTICSMFNTRCKERSRREIAAYIAEGSMTAEQGERLMKAAAPEEE